MSGQVFFVGGIDTEIGKTMTTGYLAKRWLEAGFKVITQKLVQTGSDALENTDIALHRNIMRTGWLAADTQGITCPSRYIDPVSPHLAANLAQRPIDLPAITGATQQLCTHYDRVLLEGAGGLMVPLSTDLLTIDYVAEQRWPVILVTSARLGSLNHTLLSLHALQSRHIELHALAWNRHDDALNALITADSRIFMQTWLSRYFPRAQWYDIPVLAAA